MRNVAVSLPNQVRRLSLELAGDPVGEVGDSRAIRPDLERPSLRDMWEENLRKRERQKREKKEPQTKQPQSDHRIDDYA